MRHWIERLFVKLIPIFQHFRQIHKWIAGVFHRDLKVQVLYNLLLRFFLSSCLPFRFRSREWMLQFQVEPSYWLWPKNLKLATLMILLYWCKLWLQWNLDLVIVPGSLGLAIHRLPWGSWHWIRFWDYMVHFFWKARLEHDRI